MKKLLDKNIILIGGGGHCISVIDVIENEKKYNILGILDSDPSNIKLLGYPVLGNDSLISKLVSSQNFFLITVGQIKSPLFRKKIYKKLIENNAKIATVISPNAYVSKYAKVGKGTVIMNDVVINANSKIGKNCIINTKANVEHGVSIGDFCHISTSAVVNGNSDIGEGSFIGSNATISNNISIQNNSLISASTFVK